MSVREAALAALEEALDKKLQPHQLEAVQDALTQQEQGLWPRLCLYHRTGAGKTITSLVTMALLGVSEVLVLAPPITHDAWRQVGRLCGVEVEAISHAKFRQKTYRLRSKSQAIIVDEFHLLGGIKSAGWPKLDTIAKRLQAPLVIASATPNYNDAERCYCIQHVLSPADAKGGYEGWLFANCTLEPNPFGSLPLVTGFQRHKDAEDFLKHLPKVHYVEDEAIKQIAIEDVEIDSVELPDALERYGYDQRRGRIIASLMEQRHAINRHLLLGPNGHLQPDVLDELRRLLWENPGRTLVFSASSQVAAAVWDDLRGCGLAAALVTGETKPQLKRDAVQDFIATEDAVLVGTATLATGTDGIDKVCDHLIIVDDTDDDALRRQLMGRILPRGLDSDVSRKKVTRLVFS